MPTNLLMGSLPFAHGDRVPGSELAGAWEPAPAVIVAAFLALLLFAQAFLRLRRRGRTDHAPGHAPGCSLPPSPSGRLPSSPRSTRLVRSTSSRVTCSSTCCRRRRACARRHGSARAAHLLPSAGGSTPRLAPIRPLRSGPGRSPPAARCPRDLGRHDRRLARPGGLRLRAREPGSPRPRARDVRARRHAHLDSDRRPGEAPGAHDRGAARDHASSSRPGSAGEHPHLLVLAALRGVCGPGRAPARALAAHRPAACGLVMMVEMSSCSASRRRFCCAVRPGEGGSPLCLARPRRRP